MVHVAELRFAGPLQFRYPTYAHHAAQQVQTQTLNRQETQAQLGSRRGLLFLQQTARAKMVMAKKRALHALQLITTFRKRPLLGWIAVCLSRAGASRPPSHNKARVPML